MDVAEDNEDKSKIHALRWDIYTREKEYFIKKYFLVAITHLKGGNIVWTCVQVNTIKEKEDYKSI